MKYRYVGRGVWGFLSREGWIATWTAFGLGLCLLSPSRASARVFDFKNESLATYFKGTFGPSLVGSSAFAEGSPSGVAEYDKKIRANYGGEFGILFASERVSLRLGAEYLIPRRLSDVKGTAPGTGEVLFGLDTRVTALIPKAGLDVVLYGTATSKALVDVSFGMGFASIENIYTFTAAGTAATGRSDYIEKAVAQGSFFQIGVGYERLLTDHTTFLIDAGYRSLRVDGFKHDVAANTLLGSVAKGDALLNANGGARALDLSGSYVGLAFRFYIGL